MCSLSQFITFEKVAWYTKLHIDQHTLSLIQTGTVQPTVVMFLTFVQVWSKFEGWCGSLLEKYRMLCVIIVLVKGALVVQINDLRFW